jgi:hypothetical protein
MPPYFFLSLAITSGFSMIAAVIFTSLLARLAPAFMQGLHWLGFMLILGAGAMSASLLWGDTVATTQTLAGIVLLLVTGLALYLESARQYNGKIRNSKVQDQ